MTEPAKDRVRGAIGSYWTVADDGKFKISTSSFGTGKFTSIEFGEKFINQKYESPPYYTISQSVTLYTNNEKFKNFREFYTYIYGRPADSNNEEIPPLVITGSKFMDLTVELPIPFSQEELVSVENSIKPQSYSANPVYNFYQAYYENQISTAPEQTLPDLYSVYEASVEDADGLSQNALNNFDVELVNIGESIGSSFGVTVPPETEILPIQNVQFMKDANEYKRIFPMYNEVSFSTEKTTIIAQQIKDTQLSVELMQFLTSANFSLESFTGFREELDIQDDGQVLIVANNSTNNFQVMEIFQWIELIIKEFSGIEEEFSFFTAPGLNKDLNFIGPPPKELNKYVKFLNLLTFEGEIQKIINNYLRSYSDILKGIPSYSETVAYRVEKRKSGDLITTYLFPNSNEIDVLKFVDTQVKYGQGYQYFAEAYQLTLGSEYIYSNVTIQQEGQERVSEESVGSENLPGAIPNFPEG